MTRRRQSGAVLLAVAIMLTIVAALAYALNRQTGMATQSVEAQYDLAAARYLAEAGVNMALWVNQNQGCQSKPTSPVAGTLSGVGTYSVVATKGASKNMNVIATGATASGASAILTRAAIPVHPMQDPPDSKTLNDTIVDTYINTPFTAGTTNNGGKVLYLVQGQSEALLQFPLNAIPADALVASATLTMVQYGGSAVQRAVSIHRVAAQWDAAAATWSNARAGALWAAPGGDFSADAAAQTNVGLAATYSWDITALVDGWRNGSLPNYGILVRMANAQQSANFYSYEAGGVLRPQVSVKYYTAC